MNINRKSITILIILLGSIISITYIGLNSSKIKQADALMAQGDYHKAITIYEQVLGGSYNKNIKSKISKAAALQLSTEAFNEGMNYFNNKEYKEAFSSFKNVIKEDSKNYENAFKKTEEGKKLFVAEMIQKAKVASTSTVNKDYFNTLEYISNGLEIDPNNKTLQDLRDKYNKERDEYFLAVAEAENKEKEKTQKAEAEAKKKAQEELNKKYEPQKVVDSNGKQMWKIYIGSTKLHFKGTYKGTGNFIVELLDSNQDLVEVIANEIGDFVSDKTVQVPYQGWYYLKVYGSEGSCSYTWQ